ncbi:FimV/HubP family polar landmark protein [Marinobacter shengliensis]|uniref:FimV/HubP family polar landmark protein n=1 Tax=Marinobacter shengliensis TaxID=1389223 RepID=UPI0035B7D125
MKVRKLAVAMALAGGLGSGVAQALGLGEIELQSWLNEPLDAEISLRESRGVDPGDVFVNVAPEAAYQRIGIDRHQFLSRLRFEVVTASDGSLVVNVSSREPLREPYLNFLLELTWPNGRLMREYSVLVDPPVYAEDSGVQEQVSAPSAAPASPRQAAPRSQESVRRQAQAESSLARGYQADTFGPTGPSDTLWTIAQRVRPDSSVSMQQVMLALQDQNPNAFMGGNINRLKRGEVLRVPTMEQIRSRSQAEANRVVAQQNEAFQSRTVDATRTAEAESAPAPTQAGAAGDELRLLVADGESRDVTEGGSAGGDGDLPGGSDVGSAVAMEELEATRRENEELNSRLADLQDQVSTLQRLLELKNSQLADLQGMTAEEAAAADQLPDDEAEELAAVDGADEVAEDDSEALEEMPAAEGGEQAAMDELTDDTGVDGAGEEVATTESAQPVDEAAEQEADETDVAAAPAAEQPREQPRQPAPVAPPAAEKGFPGNVIDAISNNPMYQIALGGGLVLLLLLLLLVARRNANREKAFYDQLNSEEGSESDSFDLSLEDEAGDQQEGADALAEADTYIAYGRHDQAAQVLETAISREPSRTDLRLKLLGVYADSQDRDSFEKQYCEIEALEDEAAIEQATVLRERLEEAESMPSIDDLESQLRSDSFSTSMATEGEPGQASETDQEDELPSDDEWQLSDDLKADEFEASPEPEQENEFGELESDVEKETDSPDDLIEYDLSGLEASEEDESAVDISEEQDFSSLEMDLEDSGEAKAEEEDLSFDFESALEDEATEEPAVEAAEEESLDFGLEEESDKAEQVGGAEASEDELSGDVDALDESFLDELDAELDKVAEEEGEPEGLDLDESTLDDLELDVSDEDLALMEEFSESDEQPAGPEQEAASLDEELGLEDAFSSEEPADSEPPGEQAQEGEPGATEQEADAMDDDLVPLASESLDGKPEQSSALDIDEESLGEDDDFDFLAGTDEAATKLDLARAYIEMGDSDGARDILEEVALEGNDEQKAEAQELLKNLS